MGECKNVVKGDDYGCQKFEPSSNDPLLCGCCHCHKHFHVRPKNDPNFGLCQKKHDGKYCGSQSYLGLQETNKIYFCCLHHQKFHLKKIIIVVIVVCFQTINTVAPINLNVVLSLLELHKRQCEDLISHWGFENDGLKKLKLEFPEHDFLKVLEIQDDLESCILKVWWVKIL